MSEKKNQEVNDKDIAQAFEALFDQALVPQSEEEADEIIREAGIDPEAWSDKMYALVQELLRSSPLNWRNVSKDELSNKAEALESIPKRLDKTKEELQELIQARLKRLNLSPQKAPAAYRNREVLTKEDLASLLQELDYQLREEGGEEGE